MKMEELGFYAQICLDANKPIQLLIDMPGFESPELIVNPPENIEKKMEYYKATYDENCQHKHAPGIAIVSVVTDEVTQSGVLLPDTISLLPEHVRYSKTVWVGESSDDVVIEGSVDDVIKVLKSHE